MYYKLSLKNIITIVWFVLIVPHGAIANETGESIKKDDSLALSQKEQEILLGKSKLLHLGMQYEDVISILGSPDSKTEIKGKKPSDPVLGMVLKYYLERLSLNIVNEKHDKLLYIAVSNENRVTKLFVKNIVFSDYGL